MSGIRGQKKKQPRRVIMEEATKLFLERGFENTSVDKLAKSAGGGKGTIL